MNEPRPTYAAATPPPIYTATTPTVEGLAVAITSMAAARRDAILRELAGLEREHLGYGRRDASGRCAKPTTSDLRAMWRRWQGRCPECGKELG